ncbi:hypothetical protein S726_004090 [Salmonella enterica subsp. enterica]|nr:hypothetical protein [Salmonella enterica subsp. enterica]
MKFNIFSNAMAVGLILAMCGAVYACDDALSAMPLLHFQEEGGRIPESLITTTYMNQVSDFDVTTGHYELPAFSAAWRTDRCRVHDNPGWSRLFLLRQVRTLKGGQGKGLDDSETKKQSYLPANGVSHTEGHPLMPALLFSKLLADVLNCQVAPWDKHYMSFFYPGDVLWNELPKRTIWSAKSTTALSRLQEVLTTKEMSPVSQRLISGEKDRIEILTLALRERDNALADAMKLADEKSAALSSLRERLEQRTRVAEGLRMALEARNEELKLAAANIAGMRTKRVRIVPATDEQKQAYMAGLMMAKRLNQRLEGWVQADVKIDTAFFRKGLKDGLSHTLRLNAAEARRAQAAFIKTVQDGVAGKVEEAQQYLASMAKGRRVLKSENGISWYRVRSGKTVAYGEPVRLSMTERIAGGKEINTVSHLRLRPGDNLPSVVQDGMYLPGNGGEVVAYALARDIYGERPLPSGVQPWTVMEYHLKGERTAAR